MHFFFFFDKQEQNILKKAERPHRIQEVYKAATRPKAQKQEHLTSP